MQNEHDGNPYDPGWWINVFWRKMFGFFNYKQSTKDNWYSSFEKVHKKWRSFYSVSLLLLSHASQQTDIYNKC